MKWKDGHFHGEGNKNEPEQPCLCVCRYQQMCSIKCAQGKGMVPCMEINIDDADQHHQRSEEGINKEFECGRNTSFPSPLGSQEINRDQCQFPKEIK